MERTQPDPIPEDPRHTARECRLCRTLSHPAQARAGRDLTRHLAAHPLPVQQGAAR